jgi:hypothetical protein
MGDRCIRSELLVARLGFRVTYVFISGIAGLTLEEAEPGVYQIV